MTWLKVEYGSPVPLGWRRSTPLTKLAMKKELVAWFSIFMQLCMHLGFFFL